MKKSIIFLIALIFLALGCATNDDDDPILDNHDEDQTATGDDDLNNTATDTDIPGNHDDADASETPAPDKDNPSETDDSEEISCQDTDPADDKDIAEPNDDDFDEPNDENEDIDTTPVDPAKPHVFGNICTGQDKCYSENSEITCPAEKTPFYGQDFHYAKLGNCIPQSFSVKGTANEKTVVDNNLSLEWQQKIPEKAYDWSSADNYCKNSNYADKDDWRLPTPKELLSIVDNSKFDPAIDTEYFPDTPNEWFWTSADFVSTDEKDKDKKWFVQFDKGFLSHKQKDVSEQMHVRCVRGQKLPDGNFETEKIGEDEIVKDSVTALIWQKNYTNSIKSFETALSYCENLEYAGKSDWRLPNKNELASIANYGRYAPASDFPDMPNWTFRTSTTDAKKQNSAWYVIFRESIVNPYAKTNSDYVRCVRN